MILKQIHDLNENHRPLELVDLPKPEPHDNEILVKVSACGVCHTELDEIEGRTPPSKFPMVLGHQVVGRVEQLGDNSTKFNIEDRVGVAWIYSACSAYAAEAASAKEAGHCQFCREGNENLCDEFMATGRDAFGGYAEYMIVPEDFAYPIPETFSDSQAAPLLCAGAIGYRSLRLANLRDGQNLGLTGFGASAHLVITMAKHKYPNSDIFVFARSEREREFAKELGAVWAGDTEKESPEKLDAIIDTTPVWKPIVEALKNLNHEGRLVINAIRKENVDQDYLLKLDYPKHLWMEKEIKSVANVARQDVSECLKLAAEIPIKPEVQEFELKDANQALMEMKEGRIRGAKVLKISE